MTKTVLLVAFHYPPCATSSGLQRSLSFSVRLRDHGWHPVVLTVKPTAYERTSDGQLADVPADVLVVRTMALDNARTLAIGGRYWSRLTIPDRWMTWPISAIPQGLQLIRRHHIDAIWSTYPIASAHVIGCALARLSGLPWIADFRDPMVEYIQETREAFPTDPRLRNARLRIEASAVRHASRLVFCTNGARQIALDRYPMLSPDRAQVIPNGFEEQPFLDIESAHRASVPRAHRILLHSGTIYPGPDRDPTQLLNAIKTLADRQLITPANLELRLRNPSNVDYFRTLSAKIGVSAFVNILPPLPYREALEEMLDADGLVLLQGYNSNPAVPAKLYEYLRARRPVLGLVHPDGETASVLREAGITSMAPLTDAVSIAKLLAEWVTWPDSLQFQLPSSATIAMYSRTHRAAQLVELLDEVTDRRT